MSAEPRRIKKIIRKLPAEVESSHPRQTYVRHSTTPRVIEGYTTLAQLAIERGIQLQLARIWVSNAGIKKPDTRWLWKNGSRELARARKVLELTP